MKKSLVLAGITAFLLSSTMSISQAAEATAQPPQKPANCECQQKKRPDFKRPPHKGPNLDEELSLTEAQKKQAEDLRMKGHDKIKPVMEKMKTKHEEIRKIKEDTTLTEEQKTKKIEPLKADIKKLKLQAKTIRQDNMKEFEAILTPDQKTKFEQIKQEGREKFKKEHRKPQGRPCPPPEAR